MGSAAGVCESVPVKKDIVRLDPRSNVAVATLWTLKEKVLEGLGDAAGKVNIVGTLYSRHGINYLLQTLGEHPEIDTLIVFGADLSGSGDALVRLFSEKVVDGFELLWDLGEVKPILERVRVVDLRDEYRRGDWEALRRAVVEHYSPRRGGGTPVRLELREEPGVDSWPVQLAGHVVYETSLFRAWVKLLGTVMRLGFVKGSEYGERQKQFLNLMAVVRMPGSPMLEEEFGRYLPLREFEEHARSLLTGEKPGDVSYTYGERLNAHPLGGDQVSRMVEALASRPSTRRAVAVTWLHGVDEASDNPPCLLLVQGDLSGGRYNHTVYFRSHDVYRGWPRNAYGQMVLAHRIVEGLRRRGVEAEPGFLTVISSSAHVYEHDWLQAERVLREEERRVHAAFVPDPRGNFLVSVEDGAVVVEHRDTRGRLVSRWSGGDVRVLLARMGLDSLLSMPSHAAYLGREVARAWLLARLGREYVQDRV